MTGIKFHHRKSGEGLPVKPLKKIILEMTRLKFLFKWRKASQKKRPEDLWMKEDIFMKEYIFIENLEKAKIFSYRGGSITLYFDNKYQKRAIHRRVAEYFLKLKLSL